jgi:hypothetical protein
MSIQVNCSQDSIKPHLGVSPIKLGFEIVGFTPESKNIKLPRENLNSQVANVKPIIQQQ